MKTNRNLVILVVVVLGLFSTLNTWRINRNRELISQLTDVVTIQADTIVTIGDTMAFIHDMEDIPIPGGGSDGDQPLAEGNIIVESDSSVVFTGSLRCQDVICPYCGDEYNECTDGHIVFIGRSDGWTYFTCWNEITDALDKHCTGEWTREADDGE